MRREETEPGKIETDLINIDNQTVLQIYTEGNVAGLLDDVKKKAEENAPADLDMSVKKDRDILKSSAASVARAKTKFDGLGKSLTDDWKAKSKKVDVVRKYFKDSMDYFKAAHREPLTKWEAEEKAREDEASKLAEYIADYDQAVIDDDLINRERKVAKKEAEFAKQEEDRKAEEEKKRVEKERIDREERLQKEAADNARIETEKKAEDEKQAILKRELEAREKQEKAEAETERVKEKAELDKKFALAKEQQAKIDQQRAVENAEIAAKAEAKKVEFDRVEKERLEKIESDKKAADQDHQKKVNNESLNCIINLGIKEDVAKQIIIAIIQKKIKNVSINY